MEYKVDNTNYTSNGNYVCSLGNCIDLTDKDIIIINYKFSNSWFRNSDSIIQLVSHTKLNNKHTNRTILSTNVYELDNPYNIQHNLKKIYPGMQNELFFTIVDSDDKDFALDSNHPFWFTFKIV